MSDVELLAKTFGPHGVAVLLDVASRPGPARVEVVMNIHMGGTIDFEVKESRKFIDPRPKRA